MRVRGSRADIVGELARLKRVFDWGLGLVASALPIACIGGFLTRSDTVVVAGLVPPLAAGMALLFRYALARCPRCGRLLFWKAKLGIWAPKCVSCGLVIRGGVSGDQDVDS